MRVSCGALDIGICNVFLSNVGGYKKNEYIGLFSKKLLRSIKDQFCVRVIGHVNEYPTMQYFGIPRPTQ